MNVLRDSNMNVISFLGGFQRRSDKVNYRWNKNIIKAQYEDEVILHNGLTGATITLHPFEYDNIFTTLPCDYSNFIFEHYFLVREDFDETQVIKDYRQRNEPYLSPNYLETPTHFTILSTTKCNARCPYCYENDMEGKHDMTEQTARDIVKYIVEHANRNAPLSIEWFGGEPLTNVKVIDIINSGVRSAGFEVYSKMISNGYLFNQENIKKALMWGVTNVQITLDGYGEQYNKTKRYIYKDDPNPFATVIQNIHNLLNVGIYVTIRLNCGLHNYKSLIELIHYLANEFQNNSNISVYVWEIFTNTPRTEEQAEIYFDCLDQVDKAICDSKLNTPEYIDNGIKADHCMVDSGSGTIISVDGKLCVCEHYLDNDFYGDIYNHGNFDKEVLKQWRNYTNTYEGICADCPNQAECLKMQRCTDQFVCSEAEQKYVLNKLKRRLIMMYDNALNPRQEQCMCCDGNQVCCNQN